MIINKEQRKSLNRLRRTIKKSWSKETCFPKLKKDWNVKNPALGQCAVTALIVQDYFGGEILFCRHSNHYWNRLPDRKIVDLTQIQFSKGTRICVDEIKSRKYILFSKKANEAKTFERYQRLKKKVIRQLKKVI